MDEFAKVDATSQWKPQVEKMKKKDLDALKKVYDFIFFYFLKVRDIFKNITIRNLITKKNKKVRKPMEIYA